jgi:hypothetical protein
METLTHGSLRIEMDDVAGAPYAKAWSGKARKPYAYYRFRSAEHRAQWVAQQQAKEDARQEGKTARKRAQQESKAKQRAGFAVGTVLHYSWGYDQTNCEFYVVTERTGAATCVIQECGSVMVPGSEGFMCCKLWPDPARLMGAPLRKVIGPYGIRMAHGSARPIDADSEHYSSWYA